MTTPTIPQSDVVSSMKSSVESQTTNRHCEIIHNNANNLSNNHQLLTNNNNLNNMHLLQQLQQVPTKYYKANNENLCTTITTRTKSYHPYMRPSAGQSNLNSMENGTKTDISEKQLQQTTATCYSATTFFQTSTHNPENCETTTSDRPLSTISDHVTTNVPVNTTIPATTITTTTTTTITSLIPAVTAIATAPSTLTATTNSETTTLPTLPTATVATILVNGITTAQDLVSTNSSFSSLDEQSKLFQEYVLNIPPSLSTHTSWLFN